MIKYYGSDYREKIKRAREDRRALQERQKEAAVVARKLFPSDTVGSTGSSRVAADTSVFLNRANHLLPDKDSCDQFMVSMEEVIEFGQTLYPDTFTEDFVAKIRLRAKILWKAYDALRLNRDCQGLGGVVAELFFERFKGDTDAAVMSPQSRLEWETYEELFTILDVDGPRVIEVLRRKRAVAPAEEETPPQPLARDPNSLPDRGIPGVFAPGVAGAPPQAVPVEPAFDPWAASAGQSRPPQQPRELAGAPGAPTIAVKNLAVQAGELLDREGKSVFQEVKFMVVLRFQLRRRGQPGVKEMGPDKKKGRAEAPRARDPKRWLGLEL